jgi:hypothetical protein
MHLQGDLQKLFDALHELGIIDPVLEMDWAKEKAQEKDFELRLSRAVQVANTYQSDTTLLISELEKLDRKTLSFLAMEVAREYADFHSRLNLQ